MTFTSKGYTGTINYSDWATAADTSGGQYSVFAPGDFQASAGTADREVKIAAGSAAGKGIFDTSDAVVSVAGAAVSSGDRYDLIVLRRDWTALSGAGQSSIQIITGTSSRSLPSRNTARGVQDDQPLFLVRFTAGQTAVQEIVDLRCWYGDGGIIANDLLVRSYLRAGSTVIIQGTTWSYIIDQTSTATWVSGVTVTGTSTAARLRLTATNDVSLTSTIHPFQIGASTDVNLVMDPNEIQTRNNGAASGLMLNAGGGDIILGSAASTVSVAGTLNIKFPYAVLWSGAFFMNNAQTITLAQRVSGQKTGIILVWSRYSGGAALNDTWHYTYVPHWHVSAEAGQGVMDSWPAGAGGALMQKYVYINDTSIAGHTINDAAPNNSSALRFVLGY